MAASAFSTPTVTLQVTALVSGAVTSYSLSGTSTSGAAYSGSFTPTVAGTLFVNVVALPASGSATFPVAGAPWFANITAGPADVSKSKVRTLDLFLFRRAFFFNPPSPRCAPPPVF